MNWFIKPAIIVFLMSTVLTHGMDISTEDDQTLESGDFIHVPNELMQFMAEYLCTPKSSYDCFAQLYFNTKNIVELNLSCKRFNKLLKPIITTQINKVKLEMPIDKLLTYSLHQSSMAAYHNNLAKLWINSKADVNYHDNYDEHNSTSLMIAIENLCPIEIIEMLIMQGADVNYESALGETPLSRALDFKEKESMLFIGFIDIIPNDLYRFKIIKLLIKHGADVRKAPLCKAIPFFHVNGKGYKLTIQKIEFHKKLCQLLIAHGADINKPDKNTGLPPLIKALKQEDKTTPLNLSLTKLLIEEGANIKQALKTHEKINKFDGLLSRHYLYLGLGISSDNGDPDDNSSSSSESDSIELPQPPIHTHNNNRPNNPPDSDMFTSVLNSIRANPLPIVVGVAAAGSVCYWLYTKYKAYTASEEDQDAQEYDNVSDELVEELNVI